MGATDPCVGRYRPGPQEPLAAIAAKFVGAHEAKNNGMGNDPRMRAIFEADSLWIGDGHGGLRTDGYAWCAAFVSLCVQNLIDRSSAYWQVTPPREASVFYFRTRWAPSQGCLEFGPGDRNYTPHCGDIVVFAKNNHIGIVEKTQAGAVGTIEGNTNSGGSREGVECMRRIRGFANIARFIRLPISPLYRESACLMPDQSTGASMTLFLQSLRVK